MDFWQDIGMKNYKDRLYDPSCPNCEHCFILEEYDDAPKFYCTDGAEQRPQCCSVAMDEWEIDMDYEAWFEWSKNNEVVQSGICDNYKVRSSLPPPLPGGDRRGRIPFPSAEVLARLGPINID